MESMVKTWLVMPILLLSANYLQQCVNGKPQVPCLFIFGDSLSDSGNNNNLATSSKCNYNPYGIDFPFGPTGRFTNGRTAIDIITQLLGFEEFIPPFANINGSDILKGVNYAAGGAGIRSETSMTSDLHDIGARKYVLVGLGRLGCTPSTIYLHGTNGSCVDEENAPAFTFNAKLKSLVDNFNNKFSPDSKFIFINSTLESDVQNPDGFLVSNAPCCPSRCFPDERPCYNRSDYVFWDYAHPTEAWNKLTAIRSYEDTDGSGFTYPMDIKHLVEQETMMKLEPIKERTSQITELTASS